jgi:hypothetical protein
MKNTTKTEQKTEQKTEEKNEPVLEIVYDPLEAAIGGGLAMGKDHEVLPDGEWIQFIRREVGRDDLFVYHHKITGKFVLAGWVYKPGEIGVPVCTELDTMDLPPDRGGWLSLEYVKARVRPIEDQIKAVRGRMKEAQLAKKMMKSDDLTQKEEIMEYYRKKGDIEMMRMIDHSPYSGETSGGEVHAEFKDELSRMSSNRIITSG